MNFGSTTTMVKFNDVLAHLAVALDLPVGDFVELLRVLRLTVADADDGRTFAWANNARLKTLFRGKYGPGGGVLTNAATVGFFLTACLTEGPRREIAAKALEMQFAASPLTTRGKRKVCPKTGQHYFGAALAKVLSDRALFDDVVEIRICTQFGLAALVFKNNVTSMFFSVRARKMDDGIYRTAHLSVDKIRFLFDLINQTEPTTA
jgi:hypothetical protein